MRQMDQALPKVLSPRSRNPAVATPPATSARFLGCRHLFCYCSDLVTTGPHCMSLIPRFLLLCLAAASVLVGIQAPNFVDQYEKRLDAHHLEVQNNLEPFLDIARRFHQGDLGALIAHHERSADPSFQAEGAAIRNLSDRLQRFAQEKLQLQTDLPRQLVWLARDADRELLDETRRSYSFGLLLDQRAVMAGLVFMLVVVLLFELLAATLRLLLRPRGALR